jgi:hypothetical protein
MRLDGREVGLPKVMFVDIKANVEALADAEVGMYAYASDDDALGWYDGASWQWITGNAGSGTAGRVAQWAAGGVTLEDSNILPPNFLLTLTTTAACELSLDIVDGGTLEIVSPAGYSVGVPASGTLAIGAGTLTVATVNDVTGANHTHAITSVSVATAAESLLKCNADGYLQLIRLGVGVAPSYPLHVLATTEQMRLAYDASNYSAFTVSAAGDLTIAPSGGDFAIIGMLDVSGHAAVGASASVSASYVFNVDDTITSTSSGLVGGRFNLTYSPTGTSSATVYAGYNVVSLSTAQTCSGSIIGVCGVATVANTIAANITGSIRGGYFYVDVEDAAAATAEGIIVATPHVDTGSVTNGYGIHVIQGAKGAGSITALYGLKIDDVTNGSTNRAIAAGKGISVFGDAVNITGWQNLCQFSVIGHTTQTTSSALTIFTRSDAAAGVSAMLALNAFGSGADGDGGYIEMTGKSSTIAETPMARISWMWNESTHLSRKADLVFSAYDTAVRECIRISGDGSAAAIGLFGAAPVKQSNAMTGQLTTVTFSAPITPDYAITVSYCTYGALTTWGCSTQNEMKTLLSVVANLQVRVNELEIMLSAGAGGIGVCA